LGPIWESEKSPAHQYILRAEAAAEWALMGSPVALVAWAAAAMASSSNYQLLPMLAFSQPAAEAARQVLMT
jgi:hypothetical protein